jgi:glycosyltransferase involved in cell wall biosynthesis
MEKLRIAQVAPLYESVPPKLYGGTERIVSYLTEELVRQGHRVTLFASGDSLTRAELVPGCETALRLDPTIKDALPYHIMMLEQVRQRAHEFDVLHFHIDTLHFPMVQDFVGRTVTTLHGRLDLADLPVVMREFQMMPLVSISASQTRPLAWANWYDTVPHGLPRDLYELGSGGGGYLAFLGRIAPEKGPERAIAIARQARAPLRMAAKVDPVDREYFAKVVSPLLHDPLVEFVGEIGDSEKSRFLGEAAALLFPIEWPEPFGLVLIEAMATGTPVIAFGNGSVPEIVEDGVTGFVVENITEAAAAVPFARQLDRRAIRKRFEEQFTAERMARDYLALYRRVLDGRFFDGAGQHERPSVPQDFVPAAE